MKKYVDANKRVKKNIHKVLIIIFVLLIIGIAYFFIVVKAPKKTATVKQSTDQCTNAEIQSTKLKNIKTILENSKPEELKKIVDSILLIPNYQNDQNCLYPIVKYYLLIGDSGKAREYFTLYEKAYLSTERYFKVYGPALEDPAFLKQKVEFSEKLKVEAEKNSFYGPEVTE